MKADMPPMKEATPPSRTFLASLHPWAVRFDLKSHHESDVKLANILAGDTCAPISLAGFEKYLAFVEYSVENLQFLVWFQDYRKRYLKSVREQASPADDVFVFGAPNRAKTERRAAESLSNREGTRKKDPDVLSPTSPTDAKSPKPPLPMFPPEYTGLATPPLAHTNSKSKAHDSASRSFHTECLRAVATFLTPGAAKELPLDAIVRDTLIRNLSLDCHPNAFLPVYEEIYSLVEQCSLPRFLSVASTNINSPKQLYIYSVGVCNFSIGLLIALLLIMMVRCSPEANRAWRLFALGFCSLGAAQCYMAWRGFCAMMWMRGNTQLRVWEMQEMDAEAIVFVNRILSPHKGGLRVETDTPCQNEHEHEDKKQGPEAYMGAGNLAAIAPFTIEPLRCVEGPSHSSDTIASSRYECATTTASVHHFHRPPVFGPEAIVLDPRIKAVHRMLMVDVSRFAMCFMLAFSALVFAVPSRSRS